MIFAENKSSKIMLLTRELGIFRLRFDGIKRVTVSLSFTTPLFAVIKSEVSSARLFI
jgi:hypothetical protein